MNLSADEGLFAIETISSRTQFPQNIPPERPSKPTLQSAGNESCLYGAMREETLYILL